MSTKKQIILGVILGGFILILPFVMPEKTSTMTPEQIAELEELERQAKIPKKIIRTKFTMTQDNPDLQSETSFINNSYNFFKDMFIYYGVSPELINIKVDFTGRGNYLLYVTVYDPELLPHIQTFLTDDMIQKCFANTTYKPYIKEIRTV